MHALARELLDHVAEGEDDAVDELGLLVERQRGRRWRGQRGDGARGLREEGRVRAAAGRVLVVDGDDDARGDDRVARAVEGVRARAGEDGRVDGGEQAALDGRLWTHGSVPVVVVDAGAVPWAPRGRGGIRERAA